jgi:hypothetical protein
MVRTTTRQTYTKFEWWLDGLPERHWWWANPAQIAVKWVLCKVTGHMPVRDHCGKPEHDVCARCQRSTPHLAPRP